MLSLIFGAFSIEFLFGEGLGLIVTILHILALVTTIITYKQAGVFNLKKGLGLLICLIMISISYVVRDNLPLHLLNMFVFFGLFMVYNIQLLNKHPFKINGSLIYDSVIAAFAPIGEFLAPFRHVRNQFKANKNQKMSPQTKQILTGLIISIPILFIFIALLAAADDIFRSFITLKPNFITNFFKGNTIWKMIIFTLSSCYVFGHYHYLLFKSRPTDLEPLTTTEQNNYDMVITTITMLINIVFLVFIFIQFKYLFSQKITTGMTYSSYARKGFFELTVISLMVIGLVAILNYLSRGKLNKWLMSIVLTSTLIIAYSAIFRMNLYIEAYGFTWLRIVSLSFIYLQMIIILITLISLWKVIPYKIIIATLYLVAYVTLNFINVDALIIEGNVSRYYNGYELDTEYFKYMSHDADQTLLKYQNEFKGETHKTAYIGISNAIDYKRSTFSKAKWINYNYTRSKSYELFNRVGAK